MSNAGGGKGGIVDRLALRGIAANGHHGVLETERKDGQLFVVDVVIGLDTGPAAAADDLRQTVDYGKLATHVRDAIQSDPVDLIETLAGRVAEVCLRQRPVEWVEVTVHKPDAPIPVPVSDVAVTITRTRQ